MAEQPRDHPVPCQGCGLRAGKFKTWTGNVSAFCDACEKAGKKPDKNTAKGGSFERTTTIPHDQR